MTNKLIGSVEAAKALNVSRPTVTRWAQSGKLRPVHRGDGLRGALVFRRSDVERLQRQLSLTTKK